MKTRTRSKIFLLPTALFLIFLFQNCSQVSFETNLSLTDRGVNPELEADPLDLLQYTNAQIVDLKTELDLSSFESIEMSLSSDFSDSQVALNGAQDLTFDLKGSFAADGSKDGLKLVYIKANTADGAEELIEYEIYLDTVTPDISLDGILKSGIFSKSIAFSENTPLTWEGLDVSAPNGYSSGISNSKGLQVSTSSSDDCSGNNLNILIPWQAYEKSIPISWPQKDPLDAFYFCISIQDRAGNTKTVLSQPMTSLWKVIAGENAQGNGGSFNSANVRLNYPTILRKDATGSLFFSDRKFHNIRKINTDQNRNFQNINHFAGTGLNIRPGVSAKSSEINLGTGIQTILFNEPKNEAYVTVSGRGVYRVSFNSDRSLGDFNLIINSQNSYIHLREVSGVKTVIMAANAGLSVNTTSAKSYLYEIPLSVVEGLSNAVSVDDLSSYIIAGNGMIPLSTHSTPQSVTLVKNASASDLNQSLGYISGMTVDENGVIYVSTNTDGASRGWGEHTIKSLTQSGNTFRQVLIDDQRWNFKLDAFEGKLYLGSDYGFYVIDLSTGVKTQWTGSRSEGVFIDRISREIYLSDSSLSRIGVYDLDFNLKYRIGRSTYEVDEPNALAAMVGSPHALVQRPTGEVVYVDSVSNTIRELSSDESRITTLIGGPSDASRTEEFSGTKSFDEFEFSGRRATNLNYMHHMVGDFRNGNENILFSVPEGTLYNLDLNSKSVNMVLNDVPDQINELRNNSEAFHLYGIDLNPNTGSLIMSKANVIARTHSQYTAFSGLISEVNISNGAAVNQESLFAGDLFKGRNTNDPKNPGTFENNSELKTYTSRSLKFSTDELAYSSSDALNILNLNTNRFKSVYLKDNPTEYFNASHFEVFKDGADDVLIYSSSKDLYSVRINRDQAINTNDVILVEPQKLCLPGTFLNNAMYFKKSNDGNLLISDTWNGRILKYFLMISGKLTLTTGCN